MWLKPADDLVADGRESCALSNPKKVASYDGGIEVKKPHVSNRPLALFASCKANTVPAVCETAYLSQYYPGRHTHTLNTTDRLTYRHTPDNE